MFEVFPPPQSRIVTPCILTEPQKAFVGPHHLSKILGKNCQSTTKVTLTSHQKQIIGAGFYQNVGDERHQASEIDPHFDLDNYAVIVVQLRLWKSWFQIHT